MIKQFPKKSKNLKKSLAVKRKCYIMSLGKLKKTQKYQKKSKHKARKFV